MSIVVLRFSDLESQPASRPRACPKCGCEVLQSWGRVTRTINDINPQPVTIQRFRCSRCGHTFREYPREVDHTHQTQRLRCLAGLLLAMGLSYRELARIYQKQGIHLSSTTLWRDAQNTGKQFSPPSGSESPSESGETVTNTVEPPAGARKYQILPLVEKEKKKRLGVMIAIDFGDGAIEAIGTVDEINPRAVKAWLSGLVKGSGIEVSDLSTGDLFDKPFFTNQI